MGDLFLMGAVYFLLKGISECEAGHPFSGILGIVFGIGFFVVWLMTFGTANARMGG